MGEIFSSKATGLVNITYKENKDYGYPQGALTEEDSLIHPHEFDLPVAEGGTDMQDPFQTQPGAYTSYEFTAQEGYEFDLEPDAGAGTGTIVNDPGFPLTGDDGSHTATVQVDTTVNDFFQAGLTSSVVSASGLKVSNRDFWTSNGAAFWDVDGELKLGYNTSAESLLVKTTVTDWITGFRPSQVGILIANPGGGDTLNIKDGDNNTIASMDVSGISTIPTWVVTNIVGQTADIYSLQFIACESVIYRIEFDTAFTHSVTYPGFSEDTWYASASMGSWSGSILGLDYNSSSVRIRSKGVWTLNSGDCDIEIDLTTIQTDGGTGTIRVRDNTYTTIKSVVVNENVSPQTVTISQVSRNSIADMVFEYLGCDITDIRIVDHIVSSYKANVDHWVDNGPDHNWITGELELNHNSQANTMNVIGSWASGFRPTTMSVSYTTPGNPVGSLMLKDTLGNNLAIFSLSNSAISTPTWITENITWNVDDIASIVFTGCNCIIQSIEFNSTESDTPTSYGGFSEDTWSIAASAGFWVGSNIDLTFHSVPHSIRTNGLWTRNTTVTDMALTGIFTSNNGALAGPTGTVNVYSEAGSLLATTDVTFSSSPQTVTFASFNSTTTLGYVSFVYIEADITDITITSA